MPSKKAGKTHAEASRQSRDAILRAGAELLTEETQRNPFAGIRMRELCRRAGRSTGTFYAHWPDAESFQKELASGLMADGLIEDFDELEDAAADAARAPGLESILRLAEEDIAALLNNANWDAVQLLNITWARTIFREPAVKGYEAVDQLTGDTYDGVLKALGREPRPPLTTADLGAMLQALVEGFALRLRLDPEGARLMNDPEQQLYPLAVAAILATFSRPAQDAETALDSLARTLSRDDGS